MMTDEEPGPLLIGARNDLLDVLGCILQYSLYYLLDISKRIQSRRHNNDLDDADASAGLDGGCLEPS